MASSKVEEAIERIAHKQSERRQRAFAMLVAVYVAGHVTANALAAKLMDAGWGIFTVGAIAYPATYVLQDVLSEVYGEQRARWVVWCSFTGCLVLVLFSSIAMLVPEASARSLDGCFEAVFAPTPRIVLGSLVAFLIGGLVDVKVFFAIRHLTGEPHLWLRKIGSTLVGQGVDSLLFVWVAFTGALPGNVIATMILSQWVLKMACAIGGLPVSYAAIRWARGAA